ncbi:MAG TPA: IS110 family transposase [Clostridia bacterium]|nr:IS110 family transposase [Clostridia bacterium]
MNYVIRIDTSFFNKDIKQISPTSPTQSDLRNFVIWLSDNNCFHIAMESTGVYWRPVYEVIEEHAPHYEQLIVVNAHHMRNLPGRKNDVKDAEWIATLLRHGLLEASFVPDMIIRNLREYSRLHKSFVQEKARYLNRLEKFLQTHGFKLSSVLSNIAGTSGRNLLNILVEKGCINPDDVIQAVGKRIKKPLDEIESAVCGTLIKSECRLLEHLLKKLDDSIEDINSILHDMEELVHPYQRALEQLDSIPGIDVTSALALLAEISANPQKSFASTAHISSWAGLSPRNDESAGKVKSRKVLHGNPYIKSVLCQCAWAAVRSRNSKFALWFWSHQGKLGRKKAIIAVARKILAVSYTMLKNDEFYDSNVA